MRTDIIIHIIISILIASCGRLSKNGLNSSPSKNSDSLPPMQIINSLDPDTSLAVFLWNDSISDFGSSIEEYTRFAMEEPKILSLIQNLFGRSPECNRVLQDIKKRSSEFDRYIKDLILEEGEEYRTLFDSRELWYLEQVDKTYYDSITEIYPRRRPVDISVER